jgi:hypothetical protein
MEKVTRTEPMALRPRERLWRFGVGWDARERSTAPLGRAS